MGLKKVRNSVQQCSYTAHVTPGGRLSQITNDVREIVQWGALPSPLKKCLLSPPMGLYTMERHFGSMCRARSMSVVDDQCRSSIIDVYRSSKIEVDHLVEDSCLTAVGKIRMLYAYTLTQHIRQARRLGPGQSSLFTHS